jgi:hypothetical protein
MKFKKKNYKKAGPWSEVDDLLLLLCMGLMLPKGVEEGNNFNGEVAPPPPLLAIFFFFV